MNEQLTRENLHGVWAAVATPFDEDDRLDTDAFRENVRRLAAAGVHGIYTTDSDGEFYAIELDEFKQLIDVFAETTQALGVPAQVGVTWCNTQGMVDRLRYAAKRGILGAHVGHPFFMPMTPESYQAFWQDMCQAVPEWFALIHYNTPRVHNYQFGPDYARLAQDVPNLIGTKHVGSDVTEFFTLRACAPQLSHFTGEHAMTPYMLFGARGVYSWFVNFNPSFMMAWYADLEQGRWEQARQRQERMHAFIQACAALRGSGNLHGIVGKALSSASPFLLPNNRTRRPYLSIPDATVIQFRKRIEEQFPDMLWRP
ncbi:MAG: dihydrodipicolinate synthetase [Chloroflexi bacterium]|nr:dihydrodipicolinate synthetase [Chloroflexota bacterium]